jgi:hypothetical protein
VVRDSAELVAHFLFIENILHFKAGSENEEGKIFTAECMFLQAGVHDVIMVDAALDKIEISALSSYAMIEYIKRMLTNPPRF